MKIRSLRIPGAGLSRRPHCRTPWAVSGLIWAVAASGASPVPPSSQPRDEGLSSQTVRQQVEEDWLKSLVAAADDAKRCSRRGGRNQGRQVRLPHRPTGKPLVAGGPGPGHADGAHRRVQPARLRAWPPQRRQSPYPHLGRRHKLDAAPRQPGPAFRRRLGCKAARSDLQGRRAKSALRAAAGAQREAALLPSRRSGSLRAGAKSAQSGPASTGGPIEPQSVVHGKVHTAE